jgi:hypothetical protein
MIAARSSPAWSARASSRCSTATYSSFSASASVNARSSASRSGRDAGRLDVRALHAGERGQPVGGRRARRLRALARLLENACGDALLLVEQRHQQVVGRDLGIAVLDGRPLGRGKRFLGLDCQL